jgi:ATP-dependent Clp protease ATP-binding subunit ClpA
VGKYKNLTASLPFSSYEMAGTNLGISRATTLNEYRAIEKDVALARRFQPIQVNEPTIQDTISILRGIKEKYEVHHGVRITDVSKRSFFGFLVETSRR